MADEETHLEIRSSLTIEEVKSRLKSIMPVHLFPKHRRQSVFEARELQGGARYSAGNKTVTFVIPVSPKQLARLDSTHKAYCQTTPYDYAFFGMRSRHPELWEAQRVLSRKPFSISRIPKITSNRPPGSDSRMPRRYPNNSRQAPSASSI